MDLHTQCICLFFPRVYPQVGQTGVQNWRRRRWYGAAAVTQSSKKPSLPLTAQRSSRLVDACLFVHQSAQWIVFSLSCFAKVRYSIILVAYCYKRVRENVHTFNHLKQLTSQTVKCWKLDCSFSAFRDFEHNEYQDKQIKEMTDAFSYGGSVANTKLGWFFLFVCFDLCRCVWELKLKTSFTWWKSRVSLTMEKVPKYHWLSSNHPSCPLWVHHEGYKFLKLL